MDAVISEVCNPHLKRVLRTFQAAANSSLCGPGGTGSSWPSPGGAGAARSDPERYRGGAPSSFRPNGGVFEFKAPPQSLRAAAPMPPPPILIASDRSACDKSQTSLEGETIACFVVGGEKRLCLPQILNSVLRDFGLPQINRACDELYIYCSRCSPEQLGAFKAAGILPAKAPSCGLITKTDAERLCNALLHEPRYAAATAQVQQQQRRDAAEAAAATRSPPPAEEAAEDAEGADRRDGIRVYHKCFGKASGILYPDAYVSETSKFIECLDCRQLMAARRFVCHSHSEQENRVVHWGFDSDLWRSYVLLGKSQGSVDQLQAARLLAAVKARFGARPKKRPQLDRGERREGEGSCKRAVHPGSSSAGVAVPADRDSAVKRPSNDRSAFQRWLPEQSAEDLTKEAARPLRAAASAGVRAFAAASSSAPTPPESPSAACAGATSTRCSPPVLVDPQRVVPLSEADRYGKHFVPNVSLAPPQQQQQAHKLAMLELAEHGSSGPRDSGYKQRGEDRWRSAPTAVAGLRQHRGNDGDDDAVATPVRLHSAGVAQEVLKSVAAMSSAFAEALRHTSSLDERLRLRLEESFSEHCSRLEQLFGREQGSSDVGAVAGKTMVPPAVSATLVSVCSAVAGTHRGVLRD